MNTNLLATIYSFIYILAIIAVAFVLYRFTKIGSEGVRKFIHILVSGWVLILVNCYDSLAWAVIGPVTFIFLNAAFVYSGFSKYLGMGNRKRDNGLIYYPLSILVLVIMMYNGLADERIVISSVLMMGFGDGLAALIGSRFGRRFGDGLAALIGSRFGRHGYSFIGGKKSLEGTLTMFAVSLTILLVVYPEGPWYVSLLVAIFATLLENITPLGFDNISVPLLSALALGVLHGIY